MDIYDSMYDSAGAIFGAGAAIGSGIVGLIVAVFMIICMWKLFVKAGEKGWKCIIPFYNFYILFKIAWGQGWLFLLLLIPFVNFIIGIILYVKLSKAYGQSGVYALGLIFLPIIFMPILAFGSSTYQGPA